MSAAVRNVVRGGAVTARSLRDGTRDGPNGFGFSVQTALGSSVAELAYGGAFPNKQISGTTIDRLQSIPGVVVRAPTPGFGAAHGTVNLPFPPPDTIFDAIAAAFDWLPNPHVVPR